MLLSPFLEFLFNILEFRFPNKTWGSQKEDVPSRFDNIHHTFRSQPNWVKTKGMGPKFPISENKREIGL